MRVALALAATVLLLGSTYLSPAFATPPKDEATDASSTSSSSSSSAARVHHHPPAGVDQDTWDAVHRLTLAQRVGQMTQLNIDEILMGNATHFTQTDMLTVNRPRLRELLQSCHIGSILNSPLAARVVAGFPGLTATQWRSVVAQIQEETLAVDGIPSLLGIDSVHGANYVHGATLFPQQINVGASLNVELAERMGAVTGKDSRAAGLPLVFAPILDIAVQPAWPRVFETFGECPHVAGVMGSALIRGLQGVRADGAPDLANPTKVAASLKHFIGYGNPRDGHDRSESWVPDRAMLEYFLPPFEAAVEAGVAAAMLAYSDINGVPMAANSALSIGLLRERLNFTGMVMTDFNEVSNLHTFHRVASSEREAASLALRASSIDLAMMPSRAEEWHANVMALLESGVVPRERINVAAARVLQLKKRLGLVRSYAPDESVPSVESTLSTATAHDAQLLVDSVGSAEDIALALELARESLVLLQNDGTLPVQLPQNSASASSSSSKRKQQQRGSDAIKRVLVVGPTGNSLVRQTGGWTHHWQGAASDDEFDGVGQTVFQAVQSLVSSLFPDDVEVVYEQGVNIDGGYTSEQLDAAIASARRSDLIIACIGEETYAEKPGDIGNAQLPWGQQNLVNELTKLPRYEADADDDSKTADSSSSSSTAASPASKRVVLVYLGGRPRVLDSIVFSRVSAVLAALLPGPQGGQALAETIFGLNNPSGRLPVSWPSSTNNQPLQYFHKHSQAQNYVPQWAFGQGMSYTTFEYSPLRLSSTQVGSGDEDWLQVEVDVRNTGQRAGKVSVLCFLSDLYRVVSPEVRRLKGFTKISLQPAEGRTVSFTLRRADFSFIGVSLDRRTEAGEFQIDVGGQQARFELMEGPDDVWDTELIVTRKLVKRWWRLIRSVSGEQDDSNDDGADDGASSSDGSSRSQGVSLRSGQEHAGGTRDRDDDTVRPPLLSPGLSSQQQDRDSSAPAVRASPSSSSPWLLALLCVGSAVLGGVVSLGVLRNTGLLSTRSSLTANVRAGDAETDRFLGARPHRDTGIDGRRSADSRPGVEFQSLRAQRDARSVREQDDDAYQTI